MKVETFLSDRGIAFEKHRHTSAYTAQGLAHAEHVSGYMVAKPVIVRSDQGFTMCVLPAPKHVDLSRVAMVLEENEVRLATEAELGELFPDCELGAEPPIGSMFGMKTLIDPQLEEDTYVIIQAGTHTESLKLRRAEWERLCDPVVAPIATA